MSLPRKPTHYRCETDSRRYEKLLLQRNRCVESEKMGNPFTVEKQLFDASHDADNPLEELSAAIAEQAAPGNRSITELYEEAKINSKIAILAAVQAAKGSQCAIKAASAVKQQKETAYEALQEISRLENSNAATAGTRFVLSSVKKLAIMQAHLASKQEPVAAKSVEAAIIEQRVAIAKALKAVRKEHIVFAATAKAILLRDKRTAEKSTNKRKMSV